MIDIKILRENPELIKENCAKRKYDVDIDALHDLDQQYLKLVRETEDLRAERNRLSKECQSNPAAREQVKAMKGELSEKEKLQDELKAQVEEKLTWLPNFQSPDTPDGESDADNVEVKVVGEKPVFDFQPRDHQAIGEILGIIDTQRGSKVAQSGFYYWVGKGAMLTQAMYFWAQKELVKRGFTMMMSPCAAKSRTLFGTGYLPFFKDQIYPIGNEDLCLIGTAEQTLVGFHADEVMDAALIAAAQRIEHYEISGYGTAAHYAERLGHLQAAEQLRRTLDEEQLTDTKLNDLAKNYINQKAE